MKEIEMPLVEIDVPHYVKVYCQNRTTEYITFLNPTQFKRAFHNQDMKVKVLDKIDDLTRCMITQNVKPLTVLKNPMLLYAAELEYRTWKVSYPITVQEARWLLIDSYPQTNNVAQPDSCLILIQERKGASKLTISETVEMSKQRRRERRHECYA